MNSVHKDCLSLIYQNIYLFSNQENELLINLTPAKTLETEKAVHELLLKVIEAPNHEFQNLLLSVRPLLVNNGQLQVALLTLSERLGSSASTFESIVQEITTNQEGWISNIGISAFLDIVKKQAINVETQIALTNLSCMFDPNSFAEKLALCLNVAEIISKQVNSNILEILIALAAGM